MKKLLSLLLAISIIMPGKLFARGDAGATAFNFMKLDIDARAAAMGGSFVAVSDGPSAIHYNPAGLANIRKNSSMFSHAEHFEGVSQEYLAIAMRSGLALSINSLDYGKINETTLSNPSGSLLGQFSANSNAISVGYGRRLGFDGWSYGATLKRISERISNYSADAYAMDLGVLLRSRRSRGMTFGASIQNVGTRPKFNVKEEDLPFRLSIGGAYLIDKGKYLVSAQIDKEKDRDILSLGTAMRVHRTFSFYAGYNGRIDAGPGITLGIGVNQKRMGFRYAFTPFGDLGNNHRISLQWRWGVSKRKAQEQKLPKTIGN